MHYFLKQSSHLKNERKKNNYSILENKKYNYSKFEIIKKQRKFLCPLYEN